MKNEFALIGSESDLRDMITLSPMEMEEANNWFDSVFSRQEEIEPSWDHLGKYDDSL